VGDVSTVEHACSKCGQSVRSEATLLRDGVFASLARDDGGVVEPVGTRVPGALYMIGLGERTWFVTDDPAHRDQAVFTAPRKRGTYSVVVFDDDGNALLRAHGPTPLSPGMTVTMTWRP
jgi:hypothetical protein